MLVRCFTIFPIYSIGESLISIHDWIKSAHVRSLFDIPQQGDDFDLYLARLRGRKLIPAGRRSYRRYYINPLPGLAAVLDGVVIYGDHKEIAIDGLTRAILVKPGARLRAQCGNMSRKVYYYDGVCVF